MLKLSTVAVYTMYLRSPVESGFERAFLGHQKNFCTMWSEKPGFSPNSFPYAFVVDLRAMKVVKPHREPESQVVTAFDAAKACDGLPEEL